MLNLIKENFFAIEELTKGNELVAQSIFQKNVKNVPCCLSLNNIGVYYSQYGMILKNGSIQSAKKIGLNYLLKASLYDTDWRNCVSLATALLEAGNALQAHQYLLKAYTLNSDYKILYNIGTCLFRLKNFQEAILVFEKLCTDEIIDEIIRDGGQHPFLILAYCQIELHNKQECLNYIQRYRAVWKSDERLDVFHLRYLCGMYEEALSECLELLKEWYPTKSIIALIVECILHSTSYAPTIDKAISPEHKITWDALKKNDALREKAIKEYMYLPPWICLYQYIV